MRRSGAGGGILVVEAVDADEAASSEENRQDLAAAGLGEWRVGAGQRPPRAVAPRRADPRTSPRRLRDLGRPARGPRRGRTRTASRRWSAPRWRRDGAYRFETRLAREADGREIIVDVRGRPTHGPGRAARRHGRRGAGRDHAGRGPRRARRPRPAPSGRDHGRPARDLRVAHARGPRDLGERSGCSRSSGTPPRTGPSANPNSCARPCTRTTAPRSASRSPRRCATDAILHTTGRIRRRSDGRVGAPSTSPAASSATHRNRLPRRLIGLVADVTDQRIAEERQALLIRELHHRVKNTLADRPGDRRLDRADRIEHRQLLRSLRRPHQVARPHPLGPHRGDVADGGPARAAAERAAPLCRGAGGGSTGRQGGRGRRGGRPRRPHPPRRAGHGAPLRDRGADRHGDPRTHHQRREVRRAVQPPRADRGVLGGPAGRSCRDAALRLARERRPRRWNRPGARASARACSSGC